MSAIIYQYLHINITTLKWVDLKPSQNLKINDIVCNHEVSSKRKNTRINNTAFLAATVLNSS